ncbi:MAG: major capsid protein [Sulfurimonas sp.]|nr:major capsid protein [Sulfurimonas sp.]
MAVDIFTSRAMMSALRQEKKAGQFILDLLFKRVETSDTEFVDIDIIKGKRRIAPFVSPRVEGKLVEDQGFTTNTYKPAYIKPKFATDASSLIENRTAGEVIYNGKTPAQRGAEVLAQELADAEDMIARREEWMAVQSLVTGTVDVVGEGINQNIDFQMDANHIITLSGGDLWSDTTNSSPLTKIKAWSRLIRKDSGINPNVLIGGAGAIDSLLAHPEIKDALDTRRIDLGMIDPQALPNGAVYYGTIKTTGTSIELYGYDEWYVDEAGTEQVMIPDDKVILTSTNADFRRHYGAIKDLKALYAAPRFVKSWEQEDPSARFVLVQSAPLPAPHQIDAVLTAKVI